MDSKLRQQLKRSCDLTPLNLFLFSDVKESLQRVTRHSNRHETANNIQILPEVLVEVKSSFTLRLHNDMNCCYKNTFNNLKSLYLEVLF